MRLLHTSDWHLGRTLHGASLHDEQSEFCRFIVSVAVEEHVDAVLISGDIYDRAVPPLSAVALLDSTLAELAAARVPVIVTSGNHDSPARLGFGGRLAERAGVHFRTRVEDLDRPVLLADDAGGLAVYGVPFLQPDLVLGQLGDARSHEGVISAAMARIDADRRARSAPRSVVLAHAFVVGGARSEASERSITVGGVDSVAADVFDGTSYVALGHLHRPQTIAAATPMVYSGAPLAYSFDEVEQVKSVALVDIDASGGVGVRRIPTPVRRALRQVSGALDELLARAATDLADLADAYVKVILTDPVRPRTPMDRLQQVWPHTVAIEFAPVGAPDRDADLVRLAALTSPVDICCSFVRFRTGDDATDVDRRLLTEAVEAATVAR